MKIDKKQIVIDTLISIGLACTLFCLLGILFDQIDHGHFVQGFQGKCRCSFILALGFLFIF